MELDSQEALRIFLATGLPQAYTYSRAVRRKELREKQDEKKPRRD